MERDQPAQRRGLVARSVLDLGAPGEQVVADSDQEGGENGLFRGEMPVDRWSAHTGGGAEVFDRHAVEAPLGEEGGGGLQERRAAVRLRLAALRGPVGRDARCEIGHGVLPVLDFSVNEH